MGRRLLDALGPVLAAIVTTVGVLVTTFLAARRLGKLGMAPAQVALSETMGRTLAAQAQEIGSLTRQLESTTTELRETRTELIALRLTNTDLRDTIVELKLRVADLAIEVVNLKRDPRTRSRASDKPPPKGGAT